MLIHAARFAMLSFLPIVYGWSTGRLAAQEVPPDPAMLEVSILEPTKEQRAPFAGPNVELHFQVRARIGLQSVMFEVSGEHTGIFFDLADTGVELKSDDTGVHRAVVSCPVFEGANVVSVAATDKQGRRSRASIPVQVKSRDIELAPRPTPREEPDVDLPTTEPILKQAQYKLLVLSHRRHGGEDFEAALQPLVHHKNSTGMPTLLWTLEHVYANRMYRGVDHPETIKRAIAHAKTAYGIEYVMLVGDSDRFPIRYTQIYDLGHWGHGFSPSDLYFSDLYGTSGGFDFWDHDGDGLFGEMQGNYPNTYFDLNQDRLNLIPDVAVGRVPASSLAELQTYVGKVITYETSTTADWFKRALLVTGDYPGSNASNNFVGQQLAKRSFQLDKQYHDQVWPTTTLAQRWSIIETALDKGVGFVSYIGHGYGARTVKDGGGWGGWYPHYRIAHLTNQQRLPVVFSAACETGMFHFGYGKYYAKAGYVYDTPVSPPKYRWAPEPICYSPDAYDLDSLSEHFLVKHRAGAVAFIGAYTGVQGDSHTLAKYFFEAYASGADVLGDVWNQTVSKFVANDIKNLSFPGASWYTAAKYHHIHKTLLFGDPSLRLGGIQPDLMVVRGPLGYCRLHEGRLVVKVMNQGARRAGPSSTLVDFGQYGQVSAATAALDAGQTQDVMIAIPRGSFDPDCDFRITVDARSEVPESDEANNSVKGTCPG